MSVELKETTRNKKHTLTAEKQKVHRPAGRWRKEQNTLHLNHWHCKPWCWSLWHQRRALKQHTHRCHTHNPWFCPSLPRSVFSVEEENRLWFKDGWISPAWCFHTIRLTAHPASVPIWWRSLCRLHFPLPGTPPLSRSSTPQEDTDL